MELAELVADVDDITDPVCMEKLLIYRDELEIEDDDFMQLIVDKVKNETITWHQPWYQKRICLTRTLDIKDENGVETFRKDSIDKEEGDRIAKNWRKFIKRFNVPDKPICFARWRNRTKSRNPKSDVEKARSFVTAFLAQKLKRNLYQVYTYFVTEYAAPVKGAYSETEEKIMQICFLHKPSKAVPYLAAILGREPRGINKRFHLLNKGKPTKKRLKWTLPLAEKFLKSLMRHSELPCAKLKYAKFDTSIWIKVQEDMEQDYQYLQKFWYTFLHVQLFAKYDVKLYRLRKKVLKRLKSSYKIWTDIRWKELLKSYPDGFTHGFLYRSVHSLVYKYPGSYRTDPLPDVVKFAFNRLKEFKSKTGERRLRNLTFDENGELKVVKYDEEMPYSKF